MACCKLSLSQLPEPHEMALGLVLNCQPRMLQPKLSLQKTTFSMLHVCVLSHFSHVQLFATLWTTAHRVLLSEILQAGILEWVATSSSRGSSQARD